MEMIQEIVIYFLFLFLFFISVFGFLLLPMLLNLVLLIMVLLLLPANCRFVSVADVRTENVLTDRRSCPCGTG